MTIFTRLYYQYRKIIKAILFFIMISGSGTIARTADKDAAGITIYSAAGAKYGYNLIRVTIILTPVCCYLQENMR